MTGRVHARSDADLGVLLDRPRLTLEEHGALLAALQREFPEREVDLAILNHADPLFLERRFVVESLSIGRMSPS